MSYEYEVLHGDCLKILPTVQDQSVELILTDLPYETTQQEWDQRIDLKPLVKHYRRILTPRGAIVLFADLRLASDLLAAFPKDWFRYELVWDRVATSGFLNAQRQPLRRHEFILVFAPGQTTYNPQMTEGTPYIKKRHGASQLYSPHILPDGANDGTRYPTSIVQSSTANKTGKIHPTQKPVPLIEWLIRTYSDEGDTVLDSCFGSCSTGVAAIRTGRKFIGMEKHPEFFLKGETRLHEAITVELQTAGQSVCA